MPGILRSAAIHLILGPLILGSMLLSSCSSTGTALDVSANSFAAPAGFETDALPVTNESGQDIASLLPADGIEIAKKPRAPASAQEGPVIAASDRPPSAEAAPVASEVASAAIASAAAGTEAPVVATTAPLAAAAAQTAETQVAEAPEKAAVAAAPAAVKKQKSFFGTLFTAKADAPQKLQKPAKEETQFALASEDTSRPEGQVVLASLDAAPKLDFDKPASNTGIKKTVISDASEGDNGELPGVRQNALFEIKHRSSASDDSSVDISEEDAAPVQVAYAAGLARLTPNGLKVQRESVDVGCLKPQLVRVLKGIERHYGRSVVVTSGYRSPSFNRRVRGAKNSLHMYCAATDIQVSGVSKWSLAKYLRSLPGRGGVGTYCNTESVHVDIGPNRDWNWRCSRRKRG